MKEKILILTLLVAFFSGKVFAQNGTFTLKSNDLGGQFSTEHVYNHFGCKGKNISPQLFWENYPKETRSFALTVYDPDAPTGSGWWHWLIFNIPVSITELPKGAGNPKNNFLPETVTQSINDYGEYGYGGPCPPQGDKPHGYIITLYALKVEKINLGKDTNPATVGFYLNSNTIAKASLLIYYRR